MMLKDLNQEQIETMSKVFNLVEHGAKSIDICIRKYGKEYVFEADWIRNLLLEIYTF